jgi:Carboxypeptidase regulatory-like domain
MRSVERPARMRLAHQLPASALAILLIAICACAPGAGASPTPPETGHVAGVALAGPTCPVVTDPPESACADRPVAGATLLIVDDEGDVVATATTADDGRFRLDLPPGTYQVQPQPVDGLMGIAPPMSVTVVVGQSSEVTLSYDTGIR